MKKMLSLLLAVLLMFTFVACGTPSESGTPATSDATSESESTDETSSEETDGGEAVRNVTNGGEGDPLKVVLLSSGVNQEAFLNAAQPFTDEHNIPVEVLCLNFSWGEYFTKIQTMVAGGDAPDLATVAIEGIELFYDLGLAEPLNPWLDANPEYMELINDPDVYEPAFIETLSVDGNYLAFPMGWNNCVAHINSSMLADAGLEVPTADWDKDEFLSVLDALTVEREDGTKQYGTSVPNSYFTFEGWIFNNGGTGYTNDDFTKATINEPESVEMFQMWQDIIHEYGYAPIPEPNVSYTQMMIDGDIGMIYAGRWTMTSYVSNEFTDVALQYYPKFKETVPVFGIDGLAVIAGTDRYEDAAMFSAFAGSEAYQSVFLSAGNIPGNKIAAENSINSYEFPENKEIYFESFEISKAVHSPVRYADVQIVVDRAMSEIFVNAADVQSTLDAAALEIDSILAS